MSRFQRCSMKCMTTFAALIAVGILISTIEIVKYRRDDSSGILNASTLSSLGKLLKDARLKSADLGLPQYTLDDNSCLTEGCITAARNLLSSMNTSIDPCKDFYSFSCDNWHFPEDPRDLPGRYPPRWNWDKLIYNKIGATAVKILKQKESGKDPMPLKKAKQFFMQCTNQKDIEENGSDPLKQAINRIGGWQLLSPETWNETSFDWMQALVTTFLEVGQTTVLHVFNALEPEDTNREIVAIRQPPINGARQTAFVYPWEVLINRKNNSNLFMDYEIYIVDVAKKLKSTQTEKQLKEVAKHIVAFEENLAKISKWEGDRYKPSIYKSFKLKDFQLKTDKVSSSFKISWIRLLKIIFEPEVSDITEEENIVVVEIEYIEAVIRLLAEEEARGLHTLANYIVWRYVEASLEYSTDKMRAIRDVSWRRKLRETKCGQDTEAAFDMAVAAKYIEQNFDDRAKVEVTRMVEDLKDAVEESVNEATWMTPLTMWKAIEKTNWITAHVGYPEWLKDKEKVKKYYRGLVLGTNFLESWHLVSRFNKKKGRSTLRMKTDRSKFYGQPHQSNAYAITELNMIAVHAGKIQPPYFYVNGPKYQNYGGIGYIIGHEMYHLLGGDGNQYDKKGNRVDWWDNDTKREFAENEKCIADQYSQHCYSFKDGTSKCVNGTLTRYENIADDGGLKQSFRAYKKYVERNGPEKSLPGLESFSSEQLFFIGFANMYCDRSSDTTIKNELSTSTHTPNRLRANGLLMNSMDFAMTFNCPVDPSGMRHRWNKQCSVW